jgi:hypothetical protein
MGRLKRNDRVARAARSIKKIALDERKTKLALRRCLLRIPRFQNKATIGSEVSTAHTRHKGIAREREAH